MTPEPPNPYHPHIRQIVEQARLKQILTEFGVSAQKLDDLTGGLSLTIGMRPEVFAREPHTGWSRVIVTAFPPEIPSMRIWFTYDDDNIYIEHIEALEE